MARRSRTARAAAMAAGVVAGALGGGALIGCCSFSSPRYHGPRSDHFDGKRFRNLPGGEERGVADMVRWMANRDPGPWRKWTDAEPGPPPPRRVEGGGLRITFVNHATALVQMDGLNILTDPVWSERVGPVSWAGPRRVHPPGIRFEDLPPIDAVVISHGHYDHLDLSTLRRIAEAHHPRIFVPLGNKAVLERAGVPGGEELDWWQSAPLGPGIEVVSAPSRHFSNRGICDARGTLWTSWVVKGPSGAVYFAGDTGFGPQFRAAGERLGPFRAALLPIGAFRPRWFMSPVHLDPAQAVLAQAELGAATAVAIHFGTFALGDDGQDEPVEELQRAVSARVPPPRFWVLGFGEGRDVPALAQSSANR